MPGNSYLSQSGEGCLVSGCLLLFCGPRCWSSEVLKPQHCCVVWASAHSHPGLIVSDGHDLLSPDPLAAFSCPPVLVSTSCEHWSFLFDPHYLWVWTFLFGAEAFQLVSLPAVSFPCNESDPESSLFPQPRDGDDDDGGSG